MTVSLPQQGQVVQVRQRRFVVTDVQQSTLPRDPLHPLDTSQHLVSLQSIEDDALGEELQVIWEVEPGSELVDHSVLPPPHGFDAPHRFDAFLDAVRWGTVASTHVKALQAPFRSGIAIEDYQLDPVVRAVQMPRANLLIADDVGLGKTVETGLVIQELMLRHRVRTVLVVCPSALQIQWREQMRDKFGLQFRIVDSELMRSLRRERGLHVNPWTHYPLLITSIDYLKRDRPMRLMREALPAEGESPYPRRFDLLVIDEVHNVAPSGRGKYATDSQRTQAVRRIAPHFEHRLFLSATPHNGYPESFSALLELLDNQRFARAVLPDRRQLESIMIRRLKSELKAWDGSPRFRGRHVLPLEVQYSAAEFEVHGLLREYAKLRQDASQDQVEKVATEFVLKLLKKRLFSSPAAFAKTLARHRESLEQTQRRPTRTLKPSAGLLRQRLEQAEEAPEDSDDELAGDQGVDVASSLLFAPLSREESRLLDQLSAWAEQARFRTDARFEVLEQWLQQQLKPDGRWNMTRVVIFTEYRDTQNWLLEMLTAAGFGEAGRIMQLYGGMPSEEREKVKAAFQASPEISDVRILVATDAASEGIDLQNYCSRLIHMEIPWNPSRLEQRNGRIDRHGQHNEVEIYHFVSAGWNDPARSRATDLESDLEFLFRAAQKVNTIREDLGKVGPVIAHQVEEAMLGRRSRLDTSAAEVPDSPDRRMLRFERQLGEQIQKLHEQINQSKVDLNLRAERVQAAVDVALELAGQPPLQPTTLSNGTPAFVVPPLAGSWAACSEGLAHPHTAALRPIVFDHDLAAGRDDVVLAHLNHRLVQMALRLLRAEVWSAGERQQLFRVTARTIPSEESDVPLVVAFARLVMLGGDHQRLHEELVQVGGSLRSGRFARLGVGEVQHAVEQAKADPINAELQARLQQLWPNIEDSLLAALKKRVEERRDSLLRDLAKQAAKEQSDIESILQELARSITTELDKSSQSYQLSLFSADEREQRDRDLNALQARLAQIPEEIAQETAIIEQRYADPQARFFPVAVMFLIPERMAR